MYNFLVSSWLSIATFLIGVFIGWLTNHWYAIYLRLPKLRINGSGSGSNFYASGYRYTSVSIQSELRHLGIQLPTTIILGQRLPTNFGNLIISRDIASHVSARLVDAAGAHICQLFWLANEKATTEIDIISGESASLILFLRKNDESEEYFIYQPTSQTDIAPRTSKVPRFNSTKEFFVEVAYLRGSKKLKFSVKVKIGYDGNLMFEYKNGSSGF